MSLRDDIDASASLLDQQRRENTSMRAAVTRLENERIKLLRQLSLLESLDGVSVIRPDWLTPKLPKGALHRATLCLLITDTHFDEVVNPAEIDGLNCYNREIALIRLRRCIERTILLARHYMGGVEYDGVLLFLGGDIFSGDIHEELARTNADTLLGSLLYWIGPMGTAIGTLADEFKKVHVTAVPGNHGRMTKKPIAKRRAGDNLDSALYRLIARDFARDDRVTWTISQAADAHVSAYNTRYLLTHGDQFRGGSGISGALCLGPDTRVLGADLRYRPISGLSIGDPIVGFDEHGGPTIRRRFKPATIESLDRITLPSIELSTSTGTVMASEEHLWLVRPVWGGEGIWKTTRDLKLGDRILSLGAPWVPDESWDAGWLAGMACNAAETAEVVGLRRVGPQEVVTVGTSTRTLIAEGLLSHNSPLMLGSHRKTRRQTSAGRPYDYMVMGHWHQELLMPSKALLVGPCLKGYDEYSYVSNFEYEEPKQALWLTTPERGITWRAAVQVMDRKAEGW